jgi:hypothetical protein
MIERFNIEKCKFIAFERGYEILDEAYLTTRSKMFFHHISCGNEFPMDWQHFYFREQGCKICGKKESGLKKRINSEVCIEYSSVRGYTFISEYYPDGNKGKYLNISHDDCGFEFPIRWQDFKKGRGCPQCFGNTKLTIDFCKEEALKLGYEIKDNEYFGNHIPMNFLHLDCGYSFPVEWNSFYNSGSRCARCSGVLKLTIEFCKETAKARGYTVEDDEYINNSTYLNFIHDECGFHFPAVWGNFQQGNGCPECARKLQESQTATTLKQYYSENFNATPEYKDCINPQTGLYLPFDILIPPYYENSKYIFVEVQGHQHYRFASMWHKTQEDFEYQQYKDKIKKNFAEENGIYIEIDLRNKSETIEQIIDRINYVVYYNHEW